MKRYEMLGATLGAILALTGCAPGGGVADPNDKIEDDGLGGKEDRWNSANNPERFDGEFNYHVGDAPLLEQVERLAQRLAAVLAARRQLRGAPLLVRVVHGAEHEVADQI